MKSAIFEALMSTTFGDSIAVVCVKEGPHYGEYVEVNQLEADKRGLSRKKIIGKTDFDLMPKEEAEKSWAITLEVIRTSQPVLDVIQKVIHEDKAMWYSISKHPARNDEGEIELVISITRDITRRMEIEELMRTMFIAWAHDIKGYIVAINGLLARLTQGRYGPLDNEVLEVVNHVYTESLKIELKVKESMIRGAFFRLDDGSLKLNKTQTNVREIIAKLLLAHAEIIQNGRLIVENRLTKAAANVFTNPDIISIAFNTLLDNAIEYGGQGRVCTVTLDCYKRQDFLVFKATNDGPPPSKDFVKNKMFRRFQRDETTSQQSEGSGIGLYAARKSIRLLGGDMWYKEINNCPTFFFSIPL